VPLVLVQGLAERAVVAEPPMLEPLRLVPAELRTLELPMPEQQMPQERRLLGRQHQLPCSL
jgi:hypothetical protein